MTVRKILRFDNPILHKKSKPLKNVDNEIRKLIKDMTETMYANNGAGLAAVQIGVLKRIIIIDVSTDKNELQVFLNPKIVAKEGEIMWCEACLSVPGMEGTVKRFNKVTVKAKDKNFQDIVIEAEKYLAVAFQHEIDHLDGIIYIDKVEPDSLKDIEEVPDL